MTRHSILLAALSALALAAPLGVGLAADKVDLAESILPPPAPPSEALRPFVKVPAGQLALTNVRIIDGTGGPALAGRTLLIDGGKIAGIQAATDALPAGYRTVDGRGLSVLPGIVGMHDHQYYIARPNLDDDGHSDSPLVIPQMTFSSPRMYLANGVTTLRTTGSVEPYTDLNLKQAIDAGKMPGPHMDVTGPYLEGPNSSFIQMHQLRDADDATRTVNFWADQGVTSFKAYMNITRDQLKAAIDAAHARGLKLTGHLCSVTYAEAAAMGIDDLEHGFVVNTQNDPGKTPDLCPKTVGDPTLTGMDPASDDARALIATLIKHRVAVTSTLPVFEPWSPTYRKLPPNQLAMLNPSARTDYLRLFKLRAKRKPEAVAAKIKAWRNALGLERAFVAAGGLLIAGPDPTGRGDVLPGFGNHRAIELLVEAGFSPVEAIKIATLNGATYIGLADRIGSIQTGKNADLLLVRGDPSSDITAIRNVVTVFKDGTGYNPDALLASARGRYGQY